MALDNDISVDCAPNDGPPPHPLPPLPPPEPADIALAEEVIEVTTNSAKYFYINGGSCLKILVTMSLGLCDNDDNPVLPLDGQPWKTFAVKQILPSKDDG